MGTLKGATLGLVLLTTATALGHEPKPAQSDEIMSFRYDRIELISQFLRAVYPELAEAEGILKLDAVFPHSGDINFIFRRCRVGSGVPGGRISGQEALASQIPSCATQPSAGGQPFFYANMSLQADKDRPISWFNVKGSFVADAELQAVRDRFKDRVYSDEFKDKQRYWTEADALKALRSKNPRYDPDHKKEFLATLSTDAIEKVTDCKLRTDSARFEVRRGSSLPPRLEWVLDGDAPATQTSRQAACWASFEPFSGHLTAMGGFTTRE